MPKGRSPRRRLDLDENVADILANSGFASWRDEAGWRLAGHVFGTEIDPALVEIILTIHDLKTAKLVPGLTEEETAEAAIHFAGILDRAKSALANATLAAVDAGDHAFTESVDIALRAMHDRSNGEQTREMLRRHKAIDHEARVELAKSGGTMKRIGEDAVFVGRVEAGSVAREASRRIGRIDRHETRNLLKRLGYIDA